MCSGKTTEGRRISEKFKMQFIDLDEFIEREQKISIAKIFEQQGEESFRLIEKNSLQKVSALSDAIIATGGGAPCFHSNMQFINANGISIYLKASVDSLVNRLKIYNSDRPLVKGKTDSELLEFVSNTINKREEFYSQASYIIDAEKIPNGELEEIVAKHLKRA